MKTDIILCGVGGQGILSIATVIGQAATAEGLYLKQAEVHGMSQRGGDVQSHLRLSTAPIHSDLIPASSANLIISMEPMESLRYLAWLNADGVVVTGSNPFVNIPNYPAQEALFDELAKLPRVVQAGIEQVAKDLGNPRGANMVLLGMAAPHLGILSVDSLRAAIRVVFGRKGEAVTKSNIDAFEAGLKIGEKG